MKLTTITEDSANLATVINAMVIILLMEVDECYAELELSELQNQSLCNASCKHKTKIMSDTYLKNKDLLNQGPLINHVTLDLTVWHQYPKSWNKKVEIRRKEKSILRKLNSKNQVDKITNAENDISSNIYLKKQITSGISLPEKTNKLQRKIIFTINNLMEKKPTSVEEFNKIQKNRTLQLFTSDCKQEKKTCHFKSTNIQSMTKLADKILKSGNDPINAIRKIRQIDQAESTLTFNIERSNKTFHHKAEINLSKSDNISLIINRDNSANENSEFVKDGLNCNGTMERIINKSPKFDKNKAKFSTLDEKRGVSCYFKSTRLDQIDKSASLPRYNGKGLKRSKATKNYVTEKHNNKESGRERKTTKYNKCWLPDNNKINVWNFKENYDVLQKNPNINKMESNIDGNNLRLKIKNYYKSYVTKSMVLGKSDSVRHKLPYARTLQNKSRALLPFFRFFSSPHFYKKYETTNHLENIQGIIEYKLKLKTNHFGDTRSTRALSDLYYIKLAKKVFGTSNNQYDTTTPIIASQNELDQLDIFFDDEFDDDDDRATNYRHIYITGFYNSRNNCFNNNNNVYNFITYAITNENNVNNVILINMPTSSSTTTTTTTTTTRSTVYPVVQVIKEEFPMDHNLLIAIIFTSFVILVFAICCCAPIVLIKRQKECLDTQDDQTSSFSDTEDSAITFLS